MSDDVVARAKAALEGVAYGPWEYDFSAPTLEMLQAPAIWLGDGDLGAILAVHYQEDETGRFIAAARTLVPELLAEVERLRDQAREAATGLQWYLTGPDTPPRERVGRLIGEIEADQKYYTRSRADD